MIHLLQLLVEEGAKVGNVSTNSQTISQGGGGINLNIIPKCPLRDRQNVPYVTDKVSLYRHISSGGRGWVIHLLHLLVEEGANKFEYYAKVSRT